MSRSFLDGAEDDSCVGWGPIGVGSCRGFEKKADEKLVTSYHGISQRLFKIENRQPSAGADSRFLKVQNLDQHHCKLLELRRPIA